MSKLVEREYYVLVDFKESESQICDYLASMTSETDSIRELINVVVNTFKEISNEKLFKMECELYSEGYTKEAIDKGLCDGKDIIENLKSAYILYMQRLLRDNLEIIIQNHAIKYINSNGFEITENEFNNIDLFDIDEDYSLDDIDNRIEEFIEDKANDLLDKIKEKMKLDIEKKISNLKSEKEELIEENDIDNADIISELVDEIDSLDEIIDELDSIDMSYLDLSIDNFKNTNMKKVIRNAIEKEISYLD